MLKILTEDVIARFVNQAQHLQNTLQNGELLELEIRFDGIGKMVYDQVLSYYFSRSFQSEQNLISDYSISAGHNTNNRTSTITDSNGNISKVAIVKRTIDRYDDKIYGYRIALSKESPIPENERPQSPTRDSSPGSQGYRRTKNRTSFFISQYSRLDITMVTTDTGVTSYEIEVELRENTTISEENLLHFDVDVANVLSAIQNSTIPYTIEEKKQITTFYNKCVDQSQKVGDELAYYPMVQARNINIKDMKWGQILQEGKSSSFSIKADGLRKQLIIHGDTGIWLVYPKIAYCLLYRVNSAEVNIAKGLEKMSGYVFDGENCPPFTRKNRKEWYDTIIAKYGSLENVWSSLFYGNKVIFFDSSSNFKLDYIFDTEHLFIPFDTMATSLAAISGLTEDKRNKHFSVQSYDHINRMDFFVKLNEIINGIPALRKHLIIVKKPFRQFNDDTSFFKAFNALDDDRILAPYRSEEGAICTPSDAPYKVHIPKAVNLLHPDRCLSIYPEILKWKQWDDLTVELLYGDGSIFYSKAKNDKKRPDVTHNKIDLRIFKGTNKYPFSPEINIDYVALKEFCKNNPVVNNTTVIEFAPIRKNGVIMLIPRMIRNNKNGNPNDEYVANNIWEDLHEPITENAMRGKNSFKLLFKQHNLIKKKIYDTLIPFSNYYLVGIGEGKGGDLKKQTAAHRILAIEPDFDNLKEYERRRTSLRNKKSNKDMYSDTRIRTIQVGGEDTNQICSNAYDHFNWDKGEAKPLVISMMLSLSFFFGNDSKMEGLRNTILTLIEKHRKAGGKRFHFIYMTVDGEPLKALLEKHNERVVLGPATISIDDKEEVSIHIENSIVDNQTEYLVNMELFFNILNFKEKSHSKATYMRQLDDFILNTEEEIFTSLYTYGSAEYTSTAISTPLTTPTNQMQPTTPTNQMQPTTPTNQMQPTTPTNQMQSGASSQMKTAFQKEVDDVIMKSTKYYSKTLTNALNQKFFTPIFINSDDRYPITEDISLDPSKSKAKYEDALLEYKNLNTINNISPNAFPLYRIATVCNSDESLYACILKATSKEYQNDGSITGRSALCKQFRLALINKIKTVNPLSSSGETYFISAANGMLIQNLHTYETLEKWIAGNWNIMPGNLQWLPECINYNIIIRSVSPFPSDEIPNPEYANVHVLRYPKENNYPWIILLYFNEIREINPITDRVINVILSRYELLCAATDYQHVCTLFDDNMVANIYNSL